MAILSQKQPALYAVSRLSYPFGMHFSGNSEEQRKKVHFYGY